MAEENVTATDIHKQQVKTIDTLIDVLEKQGAAQAPQIIYAKQPEQVEKKPPNYLMYIGLAIVGILLFKKL